MKLTRTFNGIIFLLLVITLWNCGKSEDTTETSSYRFEKLSEQQTNIDFYNQVEEDVEHSIINYIYYYNGGGVAVGDINNDQLPDLFFVANTGQNKLYINQGNFKFKDVTDSANVQGSASWQTGVSMVDINNDGLLDIYVCAVSGLLDFEGQNELFINNGDGTFTENAAAYGLDFKGYSTQSYFFDFDKDNDLDVYIVNHAVHTTLSHGRANVRNERAPLVGDVLLRNDNGEFVDISEAANIYGGVNGYGLSATLADFNNDGWDDIYVCNDFHEDDYYYINNQDGTFSEQLDEAFTTISRFSMGSDAADINGDGFQDLMTLDMLPREEHLLKETEGDDAMFNMQTQLKRLGYKDQFSRNMLQINHDGSNFSESALFHKLADTDWSWAPLFADFDNDGHQDLFISNGILRRPNSLDFKKYVSSAFKGRSESEGLKWLFNSINEMPSGVVANEIFQGNSETFQRKTGDWIEETPQLSNGAVYVDLDLDGDLDLVTNNFNQVAGIYENKTDSTANYLNLKFQYKGANKSGIGTKAIIYHDGKKQLKQLFKSRGFLSSLESKLYFGLGEQENVDSLKVIWPDLTYSLIEAPEINKTRTVKYTSDLPTYNIKANRPEPLFESNTLINYTHKEDSYNDFAEEKLIPYKVSTLGPAVAVGDVDNNGFEDIYLGNSAGKEAQLYLNDGTSFKSSQQPNFKKDALFEDNAAVFFDADNDGDLDLYVASGAQKNPIYQKDRFYLNENGQFKRDDGRIPENNIISTALALYDYDQDGDEDLFVGNYSSLGNFGKLVSSYILINDGQGRFKKDPNFNLQSKVTSANWVDVDEDGTKDLVLTAEWDQPYIYKNTNGKLSAIDLPKGLTGLWQTATTFDIDNDGDQDILLGNWGLNTKFNLNFDGPLRLYHSDFDKNGVEETLIAYNKNGVYYPLNTKDELASQMNVISKLFVDHKSMAGKSIEEVITKGSLGEAELFTAETLASGYLEYNNGNFDKFVPLANDFQLAPLTDFSHLSINGESALIISGNSYKGNTYHGSYSALKGYLVFDDKGLDLVSRLGMEPFNNQIKAVVNIPMANNQMVIVVSNNGALKSYTVND